MKKIVLAILALTFLASCGGGSSSPSPEPVTGNKWTIMIYLDSDNDLGIAAGLDLEEMMAAGSSSNVTVLVQHDTKGGPTVRYKVEKNKLTLLRNLGELDMASGDTLRDFMVYGNQNFKADHYALILWNHGDGWKSGNAALGTKAIFTDEDNGTYTMLSNSYVAASIQEALSATGMKLDILGIDACEMSTLEAAYEYRTVAGILVASQELVEGYGWDYDDLLGRLVNNPSMTPRQLASAMVASFKQFYESSAYRHQTISAMALQKDYAPDATTDIRSLAGSVSELSNQLIALMNNTATRQATLNLLTSTRASVQEFDKSVNPATYIDLVDFCRYVVGANSAVETTLAKLLIAEYHGSARANAHGLSIVFFNRAYADDSNTYDPNYRAYDSSTGKGSRIAFLNEYNWDDMLHLYYGFQYPDKPN